MYCSAICNTSSIQFHRFWIPNILLILSGISFRIGRVIVRNESPVFSRTVSRQELFLEAANRQNLTPQR